MISVPAVGRQPWFTKRAVKNARDADTANANMSIYTRTGDTGSTSLYGGKRISKADCQIETYGSIDELTSYIGLTVVKLKNRKDYKLYASGS